ncbi:MAG: FecR domain-containing protein [Limisphaerales bacterium]
MTPPTTATSRLVGFSGHVQISLPSQDTWMPAQPNLDLPAGSRIQTHKESRAIIQFSDRSVLRLGPNTLIVIQRPAAPPATKRFRLDLGRLFFLDRESPSDIEFETPVASGAIRGTEFVLASEPRGDVSSLALIEGRVTIFQDGNSLEVDPGHRVEVRRGQAPVHSPILITANLVQWCLYYPQVLSPDDLTLTESESLLLAPSITAWNRGAAREALDLFPDDPPPGTDVRAYHAALILSAGNVEAADELLNALNPAHPLVAALREVIAAVRFQPLDTPSTPTRATGWLARSYLLQSQARLDLALDAARTARELAPLFGPAALRVAELELAHENRRLALAALDSGLSLAPDSAPGHALRGFVALATFQPRDAVPAFDHAIELDSSLGQAWLGRALAFGQLGRPEQARRELQIAAALEPLRAEIRAYLGKAWAAANDPVRARAELDLAKSLDSGDPTPRLYSGLEYFQSNRLNDAVRDLERAFDLNGNRAIFRSRFLLEQDQATRNADLAALFQTLGLTAPARQLASRAVLEDFSNDAAHLLLARTLQAREDPLHANLRYETPRQSELLLANLFAPPGGGNLSQQLSQQDHLRYFGPQSLAWSSLSTYFSRGDWEHLSTAFGSVEGLAYALDLQMLSVEGDHPNADLERTQVSLQLKQRVGSADEFYLQTGTLRSDGGDTFTRTDPASTDPDLRAVERQEPHLYLGWHHTWAPGHHSLLLASWLRDHLSLDDAARPILFLRQSDGIITHVEPTRARFDLHQDSTFDLRSLEYLHLWESSRYGFMTGARYQSGSIDSEATLAGPLPPPFSVQRVESALERFNAYADLFWRPLPELRLSSGLGFHHLRHPANADLPPLSTETASSSLWGPRLGLSWSPLPRTQIRAAHASTLGGLYFDDSLRLEPTQVAGFTTAPRGLVPESVAGLVPATEISTTGLGLDHAFGGNLYTGVEVQWRVSDGERRAGAASNSLPVPLPDSPASTLQTLDAEERVLIAYATLLLDRDWSLGLDYQFVDADLHTRFPEVPDTALGLDEVEQDIESRLHTLRLALRFNHPSGWFAEWRSAWFLQESGGDLPDPAVEDLWQHHLFAGYRFPRRRAEIRLGILNLTDTDHRLQPLTLDLSPPRERTFTASVRLNF